MFYICVWCTFILTLFYDYSKYTCTYFYFYISDISLSKFTFANANTPEQRDRYHTWYFYSLMTLYILDPILKSDAPPLYILNPVLWSDQPTFLCI